jgi:hypothetical protein
MTDFPVLEFDFAEEMRLRYAPFQAAYAAALADWNRAMDAEGSPDPMAEYRVLNIHYPQVMERHGFVGCMHCCVAWPCALFAGLEGQA